jgi:hypothetical protein
MADDYAVVITTVALEPTPPYPFPWKALEFVDVFPESLMLTPCRLQLMDERLETIDFDLVIQGYQVWYLSPSIPVTTFLQSDVARNVLAGKPVVTVIGCRNMWLLAQEKVKKLLAGQNARLVGNIVLTDQAPNLVGVLTIATWMLTGKKKRFFPFLPKPGIDSVDIAAAERFGAPLMAALKNGRYDQLQQRLNALGACEVNPNLILFEHRISKIFNVWARFIRRKGHPGDRQRRPRLRLFLAYLLTAILLLAPVAALVTTMLGILQRDKLERAVAYYRGCSLNSNPTDIRQP